MDTEIIKRDVSIPTSKNIICSEQITPNASRMQATTCPVENRQDSNFEEVMFIRLVAHHDVLPSQRNPKKNDCSQQVS